MVGNGRPVEMAALGSVTGTERRRDLTDLRGQDHRLLGAFEDAPMAMALTSLERDGAGRFLRVNGALCELLGYTEEELTQSSFQLITHPDDLDESIEALRSMIAGEAATCRLEKRYLHKDGSTIWVQVDVSLVKDDPDGRLLYRPDSGHQRAPARAGGAA